MRLEEVYRIILDEDESVIYLSDIDSYELIYLNKGALKLYGYQADYQGYKGVKCYKFLQGKEKPCSFCTNEKLNSSEFYIWEHYNVLLEKYLVVKDKLFHFEGRRIRLEMADDITAKEMEKMKLANELSIEKTLVNCIRKLSENEDFPSAINDLLKDVCEYYSGERAYIFEIDFVAGTFDNSYEWCAEGVSEQENHILNIPVKNLENWCNGFLETGSMCLFSLENTMDKNTFEYKALAAQGIEDLIAVPLMEQNMLAGFIGVDNPRHNIHDLTLLQSITYFILSDMRKRKMMLRLEKLSTVDDLTKLYNRTMYTQTLNALKWNMPSCIGIIYMDVNGLKEANDTYGHDAGDSLIKKTARYMKDVFPERSYRVGGDEFVVLYPEIGEEQFNSKVAQLREKIVKDGLLDISMGAYWTTEQSDPEGLISRADKLMYIEKKRYYEAKAQHICNGNDTTP